MQLCYALPIGIILYLAQCASASLDKTQGSNVEHLSKTIWQDVNNREIALDGFFSRSGHTNNWAVLVDTSRYWFNYRHIANTLSMYRTVKRLGIPDSNIILMLADDVACNARNRFPATVFNNNAKKIDLYGANIEVDYRGYEVTVENFIRLLTGRVHPDMPRSKRLLTDDRSNIMVFLTGHGGDEFLKFQDTEEISSHDIGDAFAQMWEKRRYHEILFIADTCQATSLFSQLHSPNILGTGSSLTGENSYSHHADNEIGVAVVDSFTHFNLEVLERLGPEDQSTLAVLFATYDPRLIHSHPGFREDLFPRGREKSLVTDFFGSVQSVELIEHTYSLSEDASIEEAIVHNDSIQAEDTASAPLKELLTVSVPKLSSASNRLEAMFRKNLQQIKFKSPLRSSDRRKLRQEILSLFPSITEEQLASILPVKEGKDGEGEIIVVKLVTSAGENGVAYLIDSQPSFFRIDDLPLLPTCYTCWKLPHIMPTLATHRPVLKRLMEGADLMLPGVIVQPEGLPEFNSNAPMSIITPQSHLPMVVGLSCMSKAQVLQSNMRGRGIKVLHTVGDSLWALGNKFIPAHDASTTADEEDDEVNEDAWQVDPEEESTPVEVGIAEKLPENWEDNEVIEKSETIDSQQEGDENDEPAISKITPAEMDSLLETALFTAIKLKVPEDPRAYPISASQLYSGYILPSRRAGTSIDIKGSTFKKLAKFLKKYEKAGLLKTKEVRGELMITSVAQDHKDVLSLVPPSKLAGDQKPQASAAVSSSSVASSSKQASSSSLSSSSITVSDLYKPHGASVLRLFGELGVDKETLFTAKELRAFIEEYVKVKELVDVKTPRLVKLDPILSDAILQRDEAMDLIPRDAIQTRLADKMQSYSEITFPGRNPELRKGSIKPIQIVVERVRGTKTVTKVTNLEAWEIDPNTFGDEMKLLCASSTSVTSLPVAKTAKPISEVMIQGPKSTEVSNSLRDKYGIPFQKNGDSKYVEIEDKTGKKK
ncbi:hypothetical protein SmJEL517_g06012 [Synchytrium microbalum]|uniref:SUI1 domain-containing protein n=1 Tax=Synchytrium microbalum TaxID=1806994 RepID=A0A507BYR3_9FUNG|nr:uncharacterized protein SmJEL517_g06012 [Synchytrium microbalum]TPX30413.1 hypothetical protein SmJEL517_g06012 [Synchytrium microbalum]